MSARIGALVALTVLAACSAKKSAADSAAADTTTAMQPAPTTTAPDTTLPVMLPPAAGMVMKAGAPVVRPLPPSSQPVRPASKTTHTIDPVRGGGRPIPAPNDVRPSIPNNPPKLELPPDSTARKIPPR